MSLQRRVRTSSIAAGFAVSAVVAWLVLRARGGDLYELKFATAFSDSDGLALMAAAVIGAALLAGPRWGAAILLLFGVLVFVFGVVHPCRIAAHDTPHPRSCSVSSTASALGLYVPASALVCAVARLLAPRVASRRAIATALAGAAGIALVVSLWLPWYDATDDGSLYRQTGWQSFQRYDVYVALVGALACALALAARFARRRGVVQRLGPALALLALSGVGISCYRLFTSADAPSGGFIPLAGAYVTLGGFVVAAFCGFAAGEAAARAGGD